MDIPMSNDDVLRAAHGYVRRHWPEIVDDIARLVSIPSYEGEPDAAALAPFGPGPRAALSEALDIAGRLGFETQDLEGYAGTADLPGESDVQIGMIGHVDVVPAGPGWTLEPFGLAIKDGYLVGRGVVDDKAPTVIALHAMKCLQEIAADADGSGGEDAVKLPYTVRLIFGVNEETGMSDVAYYRARCADPAFLFTPDADFPVCHGEKGVLHEFVPSAPIRDGRILELSGGTAINAVPGEAFARVRVDEQARERGLAGREGLSLSWESDDVVRIEVTGKSAHASLPEDGVSALAILVDYLLDQGLCAEDERMFLAFDQRILGCTDGSGLGLDTSDEALGALTAVGGMATLEDGCLMQTVDVRFPLSITSGEIAATFERLAGEIGATGEVMSVLEPFLVQADEPEVQALLRAYNEVTGQRAEPFTMGGATYAREFTKAASFGPVMPWVKQPEWAGGMHGADEAMSIDQLKTAFKAYVLALWYLQQLDLG